MRFLGAVIDDRLTAHGYVIRELMGIPMSPMILNEWYHFIQGTLRNHISDVTRKQWDSLLISDLT